MNFDVICTVLILCATISFLIWLTVFIWKSNNEIQITRVDFDASKTDINQEIVLMHISDLHNKAFGKEQEKLIDVMKECHPDLICVTGDIIDNRKYHNAEIFVKKAVQIAPVFYVPGNHEYMAGNYAELNEMLVSNGVRVVCDSAQLVHIGDCSLEVMGIDDPYSLKLESGYEHYAEEKLDQLMEKSVGQGNLRILLTHRPELFRLYDTYPFDIVLCGHAHGGQFRIPGGRGIIAPNQGFFPKYYQGVHRGKNITEIISRGLGNSVIPLRVNNKPEIIVVRIERNVDCR